MKTMWYEVWMESSTLMIPPSSTSGDGGPINTATRGMDVLYDTSMVGGGILCMVN